MAFGSPGQSVDRARLLRAGRLHWFHWLIVALSLVVTVGAWHLSKTQIEEKTALRFERDVAQVIELVTERMQKYEDALWGGVGAIQAHGGYVDVDEWRAYAETLRIDAKYPGINGIGVIHQVAPQDLAAYLGEQRRARPDFEIHPTHAEPEYLPIAYIEPVAGNRRAVGLDIAHESNRYTAARKARDMGVAQITGPIVLVQDAEKTPGFLFYVPYYRGGTHASIEQRRENFLGIVYAPFVVRKLMEGALASHKRFVTMRITDGAETLFDEHVAEEADFDPEPLYAKQVRLDLYGRVWTFDIWSDVSFRASAGNSQPLTILLGGILIDSMLLALFVGLSRANRNAVTLADHATRELQAKTLNLERSNADLEQFAYIASHDLQEPLRMVGNFTQLLQRRYEGRLDDKADQYIGFAVDGVKRMQQLLNELLEYSRIGSQGEDLSPTDTAEVCRHALANLQASMAESAATIDVAPLPLVSGDGGQLTRLFQNLLGNALKFRAPERAVHIRVSAHERDDTWRFEIADNGIGIEPQYRERIFVMFQRLHDRESYPGVGVGLAICKKVVLRHGGELWVESEPGVGSTFYFTLPKAGRSINVVALPARETAHGEPAAEHRKVG